MSYPLQQIDLYVDEIRLNDDWVNIDLLIKSIGVLAAVMILWTVFLSWSLYSSKSEASVIAQKLEKVKSDLDAFGLSVENDKKNNADIPARIEAARNDLQGKEKLLSYISTQKTDQEKGFSSVLTALAKQSTPQVWLTRIAIADSGKGMQLEGATVNPSYVPNYLRKLTQEKSIAGRDFDVMTFHRDPKNTQAVNFLLRSGEISLLKGAESESEPGNNQSPSQPSPALNLLPEAIKDSGEKNKVSSVESLLSAVKSQ